MNIEKLIHWLNTHHIEILEDRTDADSSRTITFTTALPFDELDGRHVWYPIVLFKDQTEVSRSEIEALLRHLWHGELEIPDDLPDV
jgi:hypothetical protein